MRSQLTIVALVVVVAAGAAVAGAKIAVPADISWAEIRPYLEANIRVEVGDDGMTVGVSSAIQERRLFEPYDPFIGELATVPICDEGFEPTHLAVF